MPIPFINWAFYISMYPLFTHKKVPHRWLGLSILLTKSDFYFIDMSYDQVWIQLKNVRVLELLIYVACKY